MPHPDEAAGLSIAAVQLALQAATDPSAVPAIGITLPVGANPSASIGLAVVNGAATSFMRSDAAPAINLAITPTWTGAHVFSAGLTADGVLSSGTNPSLRLFETDAAANSGQWWMGANANIFNFWAVSDGFGTFSQILNVTRVAAAVASLNFGNATDSPSYDFLGTGTPRHGGNRLIATSAALPNNAAAAAGTLLNAPVAGNPTKWIPINDNGTVRNIPAW
jgi:hypothetical protein